MKVEKPFDCPCCGKVIETVSMNTQIHKATGARLAICPHCQQKIQYTVENVASDNKSTEGQMRIYGKISNVLWWVAMLSAVIAYISMSRASSDTSIVITNADVLRYSIVGLCLVLWIVVRILMSITKKKHPRDYKIAAIAGHPALGTNH